MTGMPKTNTPRAITPDDASTVSTTLARAFSDDPMMLWFFPEGPASEAGMRDYFTALHTHQYGPHGFCEQTDAAAAFWVAPHALDKSMPGPEALAALDEILGDRAAAYREAVAAAAAAPAREPHWYLAVLGADPAAQGQGHGAALLRSGLAKADAEGMPVSLESSKPENIPFYEHFGFSVVAELELPGGGPKVWAMWRPATTRSATA
jgi:GNAT superfamily N-acetyltransferase